MKGKAGGLSSYQIEKKLKKEWYLKRPKYLIKYDLLHLITLQKRFKRKNLSKYQEIELNKIFPMVYGLTTVKDGA